MNNKLQINTSLGTLVAEAFELDKDNPGISVSLIRPGQDKHTIAYVECPGGNAMPERYCGQTLVHVWKNPGDSDRIVIDSDGSESMEFSEVSADELVNLMAELPSGYDGRLIIQGDPEGGEAHGVLVTEAFDAKIYNVTYLGGTFGASVTIPMGATEVEEKGLLLDMITTLWSNSGLNAYYIVRKNWPVIPTN